MNPLVMALINKMERQLLELMATQAKVKELLQEDGVWSEEAEMQYRMRHSS